MPVFIGLDIGGTKLLVASADQDRKILRRVQRPTPLNLQAGLMMLFAMIREAALGDAITAIGAAVGGPLDYLQGIVSPLHQPEWRNVPLKRVIEEEFRVPFAVDVDTNAAALGEYRLANAISPTSSETSLRNLVYITVSTGMGGGYVIDGVLYRGWNGAHPEIGHQTIPYRTDFAAQPISYPVICECGAEGCLEALVSGKGIRRLYGKFAEDLSTEQWAEVGSNLGLGLRNIAALYAPQEIVLGGGVAVGGGERLLGPARRTMADNLRLVPVPEVHLSRLGYDTALYGAIALAMTVAE